MQEGSFPAAAVDPFACEDPLALLAEGQAELFSGGASDAAGLDDVFQDFQDLQAPRKRPSCDVSGSSTFRDRRARRSESFGSQEGWLCAESARHTGLMYGNDGLLSQLAPTSVFQTKPQESEELSKVRITICQQGLSKSKSEDISWKGRELSNTPSDSLDACHLALRKSSSSPADTNAASFRNMRQGSPEESAETGEFPILRPLVQTGMQANGATTEKPGTPSSGGGRRVLRTPEERKAHRMAKNRATAAASRKRKQAMKEDLLQKQDLLELENTRLSELLEDREQEIAVLRERLAIAEMAGRQASQPFAIIDSSLYMDI